MVTSQHPDLGDVQQLDDREPPKAGNALGGSPERSDDGA
jgi:hypothetical protein